MKSPAEIRKQPAASKERRRELETKLGELTGAFRDRSELAIEKSADALDTIRMATDRDLLIQRINIGTRMLNDVREALASLEGGEYGICEDCAGSISPKRLDALPWARVCVTCQEARDRRMGDEDGILSLAA
jgi:DnaK suppressor protein